MWHLIWKINASLNFNWISEVSNGSNGVNFINDKREVRVTLDLPIKVIPLNMWRDWIQQEEGPVLPSGKNKPAEVGYQNQKVSNI